MIFWTYGITQDSPLFSISYIEKDDSENLVNEYELFSNVNKYGSISNGFYRQKYLLEDQLNNYLSSWIMWSIQFDNYSYENKNRVRNIPNIGMNINAYVKDSQEIKKINLNISKISLNETANNLEYIPNSFYNISSYLDENVLLNFGYSYQPNQDEHSVSSYFNGKLRNIMFFKGHLTEFEEVGLFNYGISNKFIFETQNDLKMFNELIKNEKFFLGLVGIYDCSNVIVQNCLTKFNGKLFKI